MKKRITIISTIVAFAACIGVSSLLRAENIINLPGCTITIEGIGTFKCAESLDNCFYYQDDNIVVSCVGEMSVPNN